MKIRMGFVSNSSSSSYTCDVCNNTESGWDLGLREAGMKSCANGHTFCEDHAPDWALSFEDKKKHLVGSWWLTRGSGTHLREAVEAAVTDEALDAALVDVDQEDLFDELYTYEVPPQGCPICTFGNVAERDAMLYLLKVAGRTEADMLAELKEKFGTYKEMKQWLKE